MNDSVGVIIGRFQSHCLSYGHKLLINEVSKLHERIVILVCVSSTKGTRRHPLDYETRYRLLSSLYPHAMITPLPDYKCDSDWSNDIDEQLQRVYPGKPAVIYGGRDNSLESYNGKHGTCTLEINAHPDISATNMRSKVGQEVINSDLFRKGVIYSTQNRYPVMYHAVDVAVLREHEGRIQVLLGTKFGDGELRLIGGIHDVYETVEALCRREVMEEANVEVDGLNYVSSYKCDDWRYRGCEDQLVTSLFYGWYQFGRVESNDDLDDVQWYDLDDIWNRIGCVMESHRPMIVDIWKIKVRRGLRK